MDDSTMPSHPYRDRVGETEEVEDLCRDDDDGKDDNDRHPPQQRIADQRDRYYDRPVEMTPSYYYSCDASTAAASASTCGSVSRRGGGGSYRDEPSSGDGDGGGRNRCRGGDVMICSGQDGRRKRPAHSSRYMRHCTVSLMVIIVVAVVIALTITRTKQKRASTYSAYSNWRPSSDRSGLVPNPEPPAGWSPPLRDDGPADRSDEVPADGVVFTSLSAASELACPVNPADDKQAFTWILCGAFAENPHKRSLSRSYGHLLSITADGHRIATATDGSRKQSHNYGFVDVYDVKENHNQRAGGGGGGSGSEAAGNWDLEAHIDAPMGVFAHRGARHQALTMSGNGRRLAFTHGDEVSVFERTVNNNTGTYEWVPYGSRVDIRFGTGNWIPKDGEHFGRALSLSANGRALAILGETKGRSFVRVLRNRANRRERQKSDIPIETGDAVGGVIKLSADGKRLAVGTPATNHTLYGPGAGMVRVYEKKRRVHNEPPAWTQVGQDLPGLLPGFGWGGTLDLSHDGAVLVIGSVRGMAGYVRVYRLVSSATTGQPEWHPLGQKLQGRRSEYEWYGHSVATNHDGSVVAVGAPGNAAERGDETADASHQRNSSLLDRFMLGVVTVYQYNPVCREWFQIANELPAVEWGDMFGSAVTMSALGNRVVASAPRLNVNSVSHVGAVVVYDLQPSQ